MYDVGLSSLHTSHNRDWQLWRIRRAGDCVALMNGGRGGVSFCVEYG